MVTPRFATFSSSSVLASRIKARVPRTATNPEMVLRKSLWRIGLRPRTNVKALPGTPDLVLIRYRIAIFVDGDFWHGRCWQRRRERLARGSNAEYWIAKIESNMRRDRRVARLLRQAGWCVLRVWESDIYSDLESIITRISARVRRASEQMLP